MSQQNSSGRPSLQAQKQEFTRTRLLDAAAETFGSKGYAATTIDDIAAAAGCSRATFYLYHSGKAALVLAMLERSWPTVVDRYRELDSMLAHGTDRDELRKWLSTFLASWSENPGMLKAMSLAEISEPEVEQWVTATRLQLVDILASFFNKLSPKEREERHARAVALEAMSRTAFQLTVRHQLPVSDDQILDYLADLWADLYLA